MQKDKNLEIAQTIAQQIGNKALFMIGAKNLTAIDNGLLMKIASRIYNYIEIKLTSMDTYTMHFKKIIITKKGKHEKGEIVENVYFDDLKRIITEKTGLYTSL